MISFSNKNIHIYKSVTSSFLLLQYLLNHNICTLYEKMSMKFTTSWIINSQHQINLFLTCIICKQTMPLSFCGNAIIWSMGINMQEFTVHWKTWDCAAMWIWAKENIYQPDITLQLPILNIKSIYRCKNERLKTSIISCFHKKCSFMIIFESLSV